MTDPRPETTCARPPRAVPSATEPLAPPLQPSSVYRVADLGQVDDLYEGRLEGFIYARDGHPNALQLAAKVAALEGAEAALVCASGMAAEATAFLGLLDGGGHVALSEGLYGKTGGLVAKELARFGVTHTLFDAAEPGSLAAAMTSATRVAFVETLSNPLLRLADIEGLAEVARPKGVTLVVDHTFAPLLCRPLELGADVVVHSLTKLIGGHSDLTLGLLAGARTFVDRASSLASTFGMTGNPFESWLALRGVTTLAIRSDRACGTALELAERFEADRRVEAVHYPGLSSHPDHDRATKTLRGGFGAIVTIDLGDRAAADAFIRRLEHVPFAPSLGDASTTLSHPATTSHRFQTPEQWKRQGITPGLVRLSVGLEHIEDLWADLDRGLGIG